MTRASAGPGAVGLVLKGPWTVGMLANHVWSFAGDDDRLQTLGIEDQARASIDEHRGPVLAQTRESSSTTIM